MTGPEHYEYAETLLDMAADDPLGDPGEQYRLAAAQVHATLAVAAAIGLGMAATEPADLDVAAWHQAAGTKLSDAEGAPDGS